MVGCSTQASGMAKAVVVVQAAGGMVRMEAVIVALRVEMALVVRRKGTVWMVSRASWACKKNFLQRAMERHCYVIIEEKENQICILKRSLSLHCGKLMGAKQEWGMQTS